MSYNALLTSEIQVGKPVSNELLQKIKDCLDYLYGAVGSGVGASGVPNGSFEIDSDADGVPDSWTRSIFAGGSAAYDTTTPLHGAKAYKFTHPGGAGNGGGYLESDYIETSGKISPVINFYLKCSVAGMKNIVRLTYFDKDKVSISTEDIYSSTSNPTSWTLIRKYGIPPNNACFFKIRLISGNTDTNQAGDIYWDGIEVEQTPKIINVQFTISEVSRTGNTFADQGSCSIRVPKGFDELIFPAKTRAIDSTAGADPDGRMRFRIDSQYSNTINVEGKGQNVEAFNDGLVVVPLSGVNNGDNTLYLQLVNDSDSGSSATVYGAKQTNFAQYVRY